MGYLSDGAIRLTTFYQKGLLPVFLQYVQDPPHSPYSTVMAVIGFVIFGIRDWSPYAANALLILLYLAFGDHVLRGLRPWQRLLGLVVLMTFPLTVMAAHEFRPDHACALLTVIGGILILEKPLLTASTKRLALIGLTFGLALLTKTSTFPATIAMLVGTLFLGTAADVIIAQKRSASSWALLKKTPRAWAICIGLALLVALPHFAIAWREIYSYIYDNVFGYRKDIWKTAGPWSYQLFYYVDPGADCAGGGQMLGRHVFLLYALLAVSAVVTLATPSRKTIVRSLALFLFLCGTFFVVAVANHIKTVFFGLTFQTAFIFLGLMTLRQMLLVQRFRSRRVPWASVVLIISLVIGFGEFRWPRRVGRYTDEQSTARRDIADGIYNTLLKADPKANSKVDIEGLGDLNPDLFKFYNARDQHSFTFFSTGDTEELQPHMEALKDANYLVLSEPKTLITAEFLLSYRVLPAMNEAVRKMPNWTEIGYFTFPPSGKGFHVFERRLLDFTGWQDATGLLDAEGPYPDMNLPIIHWGLGPETDLKFIAAPKPADLHLTFRNEFENEQMQVFLDQKLLWNKAYHRSGEFQTVVLPLGVPAGSPHQVRITYSQYYDDAHLRRAVLFKEMAVLPR